MSHFAVLVIGEDVEAQLAPYHEFECTGFNDEYVQDIDITQDCIDSGLDEDGVYNEIADYGLEDSIVEDESQIDINDEHKYGYAIIKDGVLIKAVRRTNPNKKWDWYSVGGRWSGLLRLKEGATGEVGRPGLMTQPPKAGCVDSALKKDIDFDGMIAYATKRAHEEYDAFESATSGMDIPPPFEEFAEQFGGDMEAARKEYWVLPFMKTATIELRVFFKNPLDYFCIGSGGREAFVKKAGDCAFTTFAVVKDGKWYQRGEMGWFGAHTDEMSEEDWNCEYKKLLDSIPDDTLLTVIDCHI